MQNISVLWRRCIEDPGNSLAWQEFIQSIRVLLLGIAKRVAAQWGVRERAEIEDVYQDICLKISCLREVIPANVLESDGAASAYLRAIATNSARDSLRKRFAGKRAPVLTVPVEDHIHLLADGGSEGIDRAVLLRQVEELLDLPPRDSAVFGLYYRQGFTAREIASLPALDLGEKGVESLVLRMAAAARKHVQRGEAHGAGPGRTRAMGKGQ